MNGGLVDGLDQLVDLVNPIRTWYLVAGRQQADYTLVTAIELSFPYETKPKQTVW